MRRRSGSVGGLGGEPPRSTRPNGTLGKLRMVSLELRPWNSAPQAPPLTPCE